MNILIPEGKTLMPFQVDGVSTMLKFLKSPSRGFYCGDQMGLGKTIQTIAALNSLSLTGPVLVVCPAVMRDTWIVELKEWALATRFTVVFARKKLPKPEEIQKLNYLVVSYELASAAAEQLEKVSWSALVCDESHFIKSPTAKRTRAILKQLWPIADYKIALSGTPITNNVVDIWTIASKFLPYQWPRYSDFGARYAYTRAHPYGVSYEGLRKDTAPELSQIMRKHFYFRRRKEDVLKDLPPKIFKRVTLGREYLFEGTTDQITELDAQIAAMLRRLENNESMPAMTATLQGYRRMQGEMKVPAVVAYVKDMLDQDIPVVLFGYHRNAIRIIREELDKYKPAMIIGGMGHNNTREAVDSFQSGKTNLFIGQINAAGVGITLTRSSNVVIAEPDWSPAVISQACDRCHRVGQKDSVTVHYFIVPDSIDEQITNKLMKKARDHALIVEN